MYINYIIISGNNIMRYQLVAQREVSMQDIYEFADNSGPLKVIFIRVPSVDLKAILGSSHKVVQKIALRG